MPTIEEQFSVALHNSARAYKQALDRRLKDLGVGQTGWMTIAFIARSDEPLSQIELARRVGIEPPSMVPMIDRLVKHGLLTRQPSDLDKRVKFVLLTNEGAVLYKKIQNEADRFRATLLSKVNMKDLSLIVKFLEQVYEAAESI
jgi:MarR family transcriptional regulator, transcriptional regulator for hemolysin